MQLSIHTKTPEAKAISYLLAKNPSTVYERYNKKHAVRFIYHTMTDDELFATIFVTPDALSLVQEENAFHISHYINDREFAVSSIFLSFIRSALGTALNGKPKEEYIQYAAKPYPFTFEIGPIASNLTDEDIQELWQPLGYEVTIQGISEQKRARFLTLSGSVSLQRALQQLFVLIPVMDDYKHYYIDEKEREKLEHYGEGWLEQHPLRDFIYKKALRFHQLLDIKKHPKQSLNRQRYEAIVHQVKLLPHAKVIDMGAGEGKLTELLAQIPSIQQLYAVDPSNKALAKMAKRFEHLSFEVMPTIYWGSLFYQDDKFQQADIFLLCEVIEHIDKERLATIMQLITTHYKPKCLIITTPNKEYNAVYKLETMRHADHRFEWTRDEFAIWCEQHAPQYEHHFQGIGDEHLQFGTPTQMCIMTRRD